MEIAGYTTLARQSGLQREMQVIANNIANANTTGFRQEGILFSEFIQRADEGASVAMAAGRVRQTSFQQGTLEQTGGSLDFAIQGDGFFQAQTPDGPRLTRNGAFAASAEGVLVTGDGHPVLDAGGAPIFVPPNAGALGAASDGTLSADGRPIGQLGIVRPLDPGGLTREGSTFFAAEDGVEPVLAPVVMQGFVEASNVDPILQVARMVEVQRAYELGQSFLEREDERVRNAIQAFTK
jgi:flagellar basal-body rod protein FlgF